MGLKFFRVQEHVEHVSEHQQAEQKQGREHGSDVFEEVDGFVKKPEAHCCKHEQTEGKTERHESDLVGCAKASKKPVPFWARAFSF
jgi:hypothetical protein